MQNELATITRQVAVDVAAALADLLESRQTIQRTLCVAEVATALGCSYATVARGIAAGKLPAIKVNGFLRIAIRDLNAFMESHKTRKEA